MPVPELTPGADNADWAAFEEGDAYWPAQAGASTLQVVARWNVVPRQLYAAQRTIGLLAFPAGEGNTIGSVTFYANAGTPQTVTEMTLNPETGCWEYWCYLNTLATDALVEVRAVIAPASSGRARVLQGYDTLNRTFETSAMSLVLYSNAQGTRNGGTYYIAPSDHPTNPGSDATGDGSASTPYETILAAIAAAQAAHGGAADWTTIRAYAGTYQWPRVTTGSWRSTYWLTLAPVSGVSRADVIIDGGTENVSGSYERLVCLRDITLDLSEATIAPFYGASSGQPTSVWLEGVDFVGKGLETAVPASTSTQWWWMTDSATNDFLWRDRNTGPTSFQLLRNGTVYNTSNDTFTGTKCIVNVDVNTTTFVTGAHPDMWQSYGAGGNRCMVNVKALNCQSNPLFFDNGASDNTSIAVVNYLAEINGGYSIAVSTVAGVYIRHMTTVGSYSIWEVGAETSTGCSWRACCIGQMTVSGTTTGAVEANATNVWGQNHYQSGTWTPGDDATTGDAKFTAAANDDYSPAADSPLVGAFTREIPFDIDNNARAATTAVGAYAAASEYSSAPTVTTTAASSVGNDSAVLGGEVTDDGGATVTECGIVWNTTGDPTTSDNKVAIGTGTGSFSDTVTDLPAGTTIYYNAYATNSVGTSYGTADDLTTIAGDPYTTPAGSIAADGTTLTLTWTRAGGWPEDMTGYNTAACTVTAGGRTILATTGADASVDGETLSVERTLASVAYAGETCTVEVEAGQAYSDENSETIRTESVPAGTALTNGSSVVLPGAFGSHGKQQVGTTGVYGVHGRQSRRQR